MVKENVLLILINFKNLKRTHAAKDPLKKDLHQSLEELKNLAESAGAEVKEILSYNQDNPNPRYYIGLGKLENIKSIIKEKNIELIIFDDEINPSQQRNLQRELNIKVLDRTALILDVFAQRAHSREGKLQVELAQLNYLLPRLIGKGIELSRLGGGIGTRGPGETKLEVDRRTIRKQIDQLEKRITQIGIQRDTQRKKREEKNIFKISLVGYTNSGKSTLLNSVTYSNVYTRNKLFSTLDSTTRKLKLPSNGEVLISDTVGFIEKLPHQLIASFKSTLEEVRRSDLLLLIVEISNHNFENNIYSVHKVLKEIGVSHKSVITVFNKIDKVSAEELKKIKFKYKNVIYISALKKYGFEELYEKIKKVIEKHHLKIMVKIPYSNNKLIAFIYNNCQVLNRTNLDDGAILNLNVDLKFCNMFSKYIYKGREVKTG